MKYFTPERYLAFDIKDEQVFLSAHQQWEEAISAYSAHLDEIKAKLPRKFYRFIETVYLHDARVLSMHQNENSFVITLAPDTDPSHLAVLLYTLVEDPVVLTDQLPANRRREPTEWLYDELDLDRPEGPQGIPVASDTPTFRHNILLSNGWEIILRFRSVGVVRPLRVMPLPPTKSAVAS